MQRQTPAPDVRTLRPDTPPALASTIERAVERAGQDGAGQEFPIDVTFPGEGEPDQVDAWISDHAEPFYIRA